MQTPQDLCYAGFFMPISNTLASVAYWLLKSEPDVFGIDDLCKQKSAVWDGVRNYQARNHLRAMQVGDLAFFYHSSAQHIGIAGTCSVVEANLPDPSQFNPESEYFDPKSTPQNPRWWTVKIKFEQKFKHLLSLDELRSRFSPDDFILLRKGNRLSVMPVEEKVALAILKLALD